MVRLDVARRGKDVAGPCHVGGCKEPAERSIPGERAVEHVEGIEFGDSPGRKLPRAHLCRKHYKEFKKSSKEDRVADTLGHRAGSRVDHQLGGGG